MSIEYRHNTSSQLDILYHLQNVSSAFVHDLSNRVDVKEYSQKLFSLAEREEAWSGDNLIGLVAYYINYDTQKAFITNVSVDIRFQKQGVATKLLENAKCVAIEERMKLISLEAANDDELIAFYLHNGFVEEKQMPNGNKILIKNLVPIVVIRCTVYNHEPYLRDCLEGFVMQQTNFPFVAIVHDDASIDGSAAIIREYEEKYPDIIKPIYEKENQWRKGTLTKVMNVAIEATGAKYVAMCEGDDYWTDPLKLQKQVDILEADESLMLCCTNCSVVDNHSMEIQAVRGGVVKNDVQGRYNLRDFFRDNHQYPTLSVVYRRTHVEEIGEKYARTRNAFLGDWTLWICLLIYGDAYFLNEVTCAYRINPTSVTHSNVDARRLGLAKANFKLLPAVASILPNEYQDIKDDLTKNTAWMWFNLANAYRRQRQYIRMLGCMIVCCIKEPKMLFNKIRNRK